MAYNDRYWVEKNKRAQVAKQHTKEMEEKYADEIEECADNTVIFNDSSVTAIESDNVPDVIVEDIDTVGAILKYNAGKTACLNFASYKNAGGMFIEGSRAQEECLCHESFLYNVLSKKTEYYDWNNKNKNRALYLNRALYSPNVLFLRNAENVFCDVITCAAPNRTTFIKHGESGKIAENTNLYALTERIEFVKKIAEYNNVETLILGAFGCGVFGQDANVVASLFKEAFKTSSVKTIIYAVPSGRDKDNFEAFTKCFK